MGTSVETIVIDVPLDEAPGVCAAALTRGGFKRVNAAGATVVTAEKKAFGQWTKGQVTLVLSLAPDDSTTVTVTAQASAQSIGSLASDPAKRLVGSVVTKLREVA